MKRSGREPRWADLPPARTRFAAEAAFLILVAVGAALARLSPLSIIGLMLVAWILVALIERASSREQAKSLAGADETDIFAMPATMPAQAEVEEPVVETPSGHRALRWLRWRRQRPAVEPVATTAATLNQRPSRAHVRRIETEPPPPAIEVEPAVAELVVEETPPLRGPAVTKRPLDLPGLEEPETARAAAPRSATAKPAEARSPEPAPAPTPVEPPVIEPPVEVSPEPPPVERRPPPPPEPLRAPPPPPGPPREWNIWDLERRARQQTGNALRSEEWAALFMHLRQFANADGVLPLQFDDLVRESFSELIQAA